MFKAEYRRVQGFCADFDSTRQDFDPVWVPFSAQNALETLKRGQTSDRNGFSTLKTEGYHVASPWDVNNFF